MIDKNQKNRFSQTELSMIKSTFADNFELLTVIRKFMLQMPLNAQEEKTLETLRVEGVFSVLKKCFLPELDGDCPINQNIDLFMTVKLDDKSPEDALLVLKGREILINYINQQLNAILGTVVVPPIIFADLTDLDGSPQTVLPRVTARNTMVSHVDQQLNQLFLLAGMPEETVEETLARLAKNSTK